MALFDVKYGAEDFEVFSYFPAHDIEYLGPVLQNYTNAQKQVELDP